MPSSPQGKRQQYPRPTEGGGSNTLNCHPPKRKAAIPSDRAPQIWRSLKRCSFPVSVRGRLETNSISRGYLNGAIDPLT